jgi:hypothetical protein
MVALPPFAEAEIETAYFASLFGRFARTGANGFKSLRLPLRHARRIAHERVWPDEPVSLI